MEASTANPEGLVVADEASILTNQANMAKALAYPWAGWCAAAFQDSIVPILRPAWAGAGGDRTKFMQNKANSRAWFNSG